MESLLYLIALVGFVTCAGASWAIGHASPKMGFTLAVLAGVIAIASRFAFSAEAPKDTHVSILVELGELFLKLWIGVSGVLAGVAAVFLVIGAVHRLLARE